MSYEFMLAVRYLRSRRHEHFVSLIGWSSGIGVAIGVATLIVVLSVMIGAGVELRDRILGLSPHVDIQGQGDRLAAWQEWVGKVEPLPGVDVALPYVITQVMATHGRFVSGALLKGVEPEKEDILPKYMISGRFEDLAVGENPFRVVIGKKLARKLGLSVGSRVNLLSPATGIGPSGMMPRLRSFEVVGIFDSGFYEYDAGFIFAPLKAVQALQRMGNDVSGIELRIRDRDAAAEIARHVRAVLPPEAWVTDWMQRHHSFFQALKQERIAMGVILSLIILVAVFNMVASLVMVVMERRKEIAILKTVGARDASVMRIFLFMGAMITGIGTLTGLGLGLLLSWKLDVFLAWIEKISGIEFMSGDVYYIDHVPSMIDPVAVGIIVAVSLCMGIMATFYPAWRAAKVPPADALRYE
jgi:lipoprotein-releasing system permease protein